MPILAKESSEKVYLNIHQISSLEFHSSHSIFHEDLLVFFIVNGFLTEKQEAYIDICYTCTKCNELNDDGHSSNFGWK